MVTVVAVVPGDITAGAIALDFLGSQLPLEYSLLMLMTQREGLLLLAFETPIRGQLVELLPQRLFATAVELGAEAIVAQQSDEMLLTQLIGELDEHVVLVQFVAARFDDVEDVVGFVARTGDSVKFVTRYCAELRDEVLVRGDVKVHPELPVIAHRKAQSVEVAENVLEGSWVIVLELDGLLLALLQHMCQLLIRSIRPFMRLTAKSLRRPESFRK